MIADRSRKISSAGCNGVPKAKGRRYTSEDNHKNRRRVHRKEQICFNNREKNHLTIAELFGAGDRCIFMQKYWGQLRVEVSLLARLVGVIRRFE